LTLLIVFGLVRPALAEDIPPAPPLLAAPRVRTLAQTWTMPPAQPAVAAPIVVCAPPPEPSPVYTRWSFWLSVGVAAAAGVVAGVLYERWNHGVDMPTTTFGTK
jgi:hypothetical protein